jgi:hypothetical protein
MFGPVGTDPIALTSELVTRAEPPLGRAPERVAGVLGTILGLGDIAETVCDWLGNNGGQSA